MTFEHNSGVGILTVAVLALACALAAVALARTGDGGDGGDGSRERFRLLDAVSGHAPDVYGLDRRTGEVYLVNPEGMRRIGTLGEGEKGSGGS